MGFSPYLLLVGKRTGTLILPWIIQNELSEVLQSFIIAAASLSALPSSPLPLLTSSFFPSSYLLPSFCFFSLPSFFFIYYLFFKVRLLYVAQAAGWSLTPEFKWSSHFNLPHSQTMPDDYIFCQVILLINALGLGVHYNSA
jgi:hypothetical protein